MTWAAYIIAFPPTNFPVSTHANYNTRKGIESDDELIHLSESKFSWVRLINIKGCMVDFIQVFMACDISSLAFRASFMLIIQGTKIIFAFFFKCGKNMEQLAKTSLKTKLVFPNLKQISTINSNYLSVKNI